MVLFSLVASHADIDLETVAQLSNGASGIATSALSESPAVTGAVVLATCNRYEIYGEAPHPDDVEAARAALVAQISEASGLGEPLVSRSFSTRTGPEVTQHLFAVSAGLDSAVVGEREIAGQVRRALITAQHEGTASSGLVRLFQAASKTAKDVGAQTALGSRGLSIVSVALDLATDLSENADWSTKKVVVFGTGAYAGATMALLRERGCTDISVFSSSGRAEGFVATRGGSALDADSLRPAVAAADVMIGCSGSDTRVEADELALVRADSPQPLIAIDLALTHDFDPGVGELDGVELLTLESVRLAAPQEQAESLSQASGIVSGAATAFEQEREARSVDSAIVALRRHTMNVLDAEMEKVRARHGCTAAAEEVEFALRRMVKQLLHVPTVRARELAANGQQDEYVAALEALYGITVEQPAARAVPEAECPVDHKGLETA
ncbi:MULTISPECIES: glutamyl-tRNA reductase [Micrococcaceae]|uniref:Glutamyl-tRNA reductase n=1 Tax=Pseudarthrobacter siccitolerans TaxID=861266 RepID=A0ABU0PHW6_9MICC|nr:MULTISPECIES: glutamyl-tRNA reductase [Micrococcaceae]MDQ0673541.1 glutamyl-tRNA reductase [Pseudarthrobacter siccitolerans]MDQ0690297.1 glutamyl-tRNA reductase [Arthrobacter sp. W4I7]